MRYSHQKFLKNLEQLHMGLGTWERVAKFLGVSKSTIYRWRKGMSEPPDWIKQKYGMVYTSRKVKIVIYGIARTKEKKKKTRKKGGKSHDGMGKI